MPFLWVLPLVALPVQLHAHLRERPLVPARAVPAGCGAAAGAGRLRPAVADWASACRPRCRCTSAACSSGAWCCTANSRAAGLRPRYLTRFYLMLSLGGALGGVAVGLVAPRAPAGLLRAGLGLVMLALLGVVLSRRSRRPGLAVCAAAAGAASRRLPGAGRSRDDTRRHARAVAQLLRHAAHQRSSREARATRAADVPRRRQARRAVPRPERRREPTTYYGASSGVGRAIRSAPPGPRRIGLIGLGAGTLAAMRGRATSSASTRSTRRCSTLADREFSFLADSPARIERVLGDARWRWSASRRRASTCWRSTPSPATRCRCTC